MTPIDVFTKVTFAPLAILAIVFSTGLYLYGVRRMAARARKWPAYRTALLLTGELALAFGLVSGIDAKDHVFSAYAIQHILIGIIAPLCFALSAPLTLMVQAGSPRVRDTTLAALDSRAARVIFNPFFTWAFYAGSVATLYSTGLYALSMRNDVVNTLVHVDLILAGCLFWWPLIGADPIPRRMGYWGKMLYLILAMPFYTILGMSLESQSKGIARGMSVTEVHTGGGLLWCAGEAMGLLGAIVFFVLWLKADERAAKQSDEYTEESAARQLAHWRATHDGGGARHIQLTQLITLDDLLAARDRVKTVLRATPVDRSDSLSRQAGRAVLLKPEQQQRTGSFKVRGAYNRIAQLPEEIAVVAASAGNHAQGVALAASLTGRQSTIFMPTGAALPKIEATRAYGATVRLEGELVDDSLMLAQAFAADTGAVFVPPFDDPDVIAGQGTIGLELVEEAPDVEAIVVPVGGGGLLAGVAASVALQPPNRSRPKVIGVEAAGAPTLTRALKAGHPVTLDRLATMADGIAVARCSELTLAHAQAFADQVITVDEESISEAMLLLVERAKAVVEPSGAVSLAAILSGRIPGRGPVVAVLSGGNVDPLLLTKLIEHGLSAAGRYLTLRVVMPDRVGALAALTGELAHLGINVLDVEHHRSGRPLAVAEVEVQVTVETRDTDHHYEIVEALTSAGYRAGPLD